MMGTLKRGVMMARTRTLMSVWPGFQLVLSSARNLDPLRLSRRTIT